MLLGFCCFVWCSKVENTLCSSVQELFKSLVMKFFFGGGLMLVVQGVGMELLHDVPLRHI